MRQLGLVICLVFTATGYAQVETFPPAPTPIPRPVPVPVPVPFYGYTASAIDHNGNLLVFDAMYSYPAPLLGQPIFLRLPPSVKTRITVITGDGNRMPPVEYEGSFQVIGAGWHAIYALVNSYTPVSQGMSFSASRRVVALNVVAGVLPLSLPSVDVPLRADLRFAPAADRTAADILSFVDMVVPYILPAPTDRSLPPPPTRFAQIVKYFGRAQFAVGTPIPLP